MYFSQTWKFDDSKNTSVNQRKSKNHEELNFSHEKVQKYEKNRKSKNGKCEILRPISAAEIGLKKWWSQKTSTRGANWGKFSKKKLSKKSDFSFQNMNKTESPKMTSKVVKELLKRSYEWLKYFSQTWNLTIAKNTNGESKNHKELNFSKGKTKKNVT